MASPAVLGGVGAVLSTDKGKRFLKGFADALTGGLTDFDQKGDNRIQQFQKNQMSRNINAAKGFGDFMTGGLTDFDQKGDNRLQEFQKNQMKRNMRAAAGLADFMTGGLTDFDQQGDSRMQQMGKEMMFGGAKGVVQPLGAVQNQFMG
jgi:hypothetical protein|tara:strand:- start:590 stop:1033 length:444 start_codon:yes stop_codon:yes gene_type:complete